MANYEENRRQNIDILGNLPRGIMQKICLFLTPQDILNIWTHFPQWKWLMNDEYFWQKKCKQVSFYPVGEASKSPCYKKFAEKFGYWQATYFYRETMDYNWENMIYEEIPLENEGPLKKVYHFDDEMLVATTTNSKIKIFNSITGKLEKSFSIVGNGKIIEIKKQDNLLVCVTELYVIAWNLQHDSVLNTWSLGNRINRVIRLLIYQNFVATVVQYSDWGKVNELFILNVNSAIPHSRTPNVGDVLFYDNMAALLVKGSVKVMNTYDHSITNRLCYSADNHRVINIRSQNEYVIGLCEFPDHLHFSVWNMGTSDLVTFLAIIKLIMSPLIC